MPSVTAKVRRTACARSGIMPSDRAKNNYRFIEVGDWEKLILSQPLIIVIDFVPFRSRGMSIKLDARATLHQNVVAMLHRKSTAIVFEDIKYPYIEGNIFRNFLKTLNNRRGNINDRIL